MKRRIFHLTNYIDKPRVKLPLICKACGHIIQEDEKFETTFSAKNVYCQNCMDKPVLIYPILSCGKNGREKIKLQLLEKEAKP
jgi:hypothetical protein